MSQNQDTTGEELYNISLPISYRVEFCVVLGHVDPIFVPVRMAPIEIEVLGGKPPD